MGYCKKEKKKATRRSGAVPSIEGASRDECSGCGEIGDAEEQSNWGNEPPTHDGRIARFVMDQQRAMEAV